MSGGATHDTHPVIFRGARVLTMGGRAGVRRGEAMDDLGVIDQADVLVAGGQVVAMGIADSLRETLRTLGGNVEEILVRGRVLMPGFVDCHTHMCWAGSRVDEWERGLQGESYQQILASGGGIMSTVRATREASQGELACDLVGRADQAARYGSTTIEVKTGYGLTLEHELKMLRAIRQAGAYSVATLVPTALLGHAIDSSFPGGREAFIGHVIGELLPRMSMECPGCAVDAFCENGAWTLDECVRVFEAARDAGHPVRVHADQFNSLGMVARAVEFGARSVDHLEATSEHDARLLASSGTVGVVLPCCGFHVDGRYASARRLVDLGGAVAVASNANPGSAPCVSMAMAAGLAVRRCGLSPREVLSACTINPAWVLGLSDRGYIGVAARADMILLRERDERCVSYEFGSNPVELVMVGGRVIEG